MNRKLLLSLAAVVLMIAVMQVQGAPLAQRIKGGIVALEFSWNDFNFWKNLYWMGRETVLTNIWLDFAFIAAYTWFLRNAALAVAPRFGGSALPITFARLALVAGALDVVENVAMLGRIYTWFGAGAPFVASLCAAVKFAAAAAVLVFLAYALLSKPAAARKPGV